mmetsp:Transcript_15044/g.37463  ORF Transcript_15044/g.37463 Transcript_15044/m.37463 type:complete len:1016 (-) Transcript_15044:147-3194(-)|eukprot:CAMPEP_0178987398 /NCGR_PEP_ID=MMETSP0795-20121207/3245_1 /TAXON_ID=88552 /ORGANISM="Amoebophrya sp., Strain Ameob2" /LENGTH=1015 /DNA_ID=CAMNT_0020678581 /DNA_START=144 /DNA_END=3191 /DNA_ORIENTATION=-
MAGPGGGPGSGVSTVSKEARWRERRSASRRRRGFRISSVSNMLLVLCATSTPLRTNGSTVASFGNARRRSVQATQCLDDVGFRDDDGHPCSWWRGKACRDASSIYGHSPFGQAQLLCHCGESCIDAGNSHCLTSDTCFESCAVPSAGNAFPSMCQSGVAGAPAGAQGQGGGYARLHKCNYGNQCASKFCCPALKICLENEGDTVSSVDMMMLQQQQGVDGLRVVVGQEGACSPSAVFANREACLHLSSSGLPPATHDIRQCGCKTSYLLQLYQNQWVTCAGAQPRCRRRPNPEKHTVAFALRVPMQLDISMGFTGSALQADVLFVQALQTAVLGSVRNVLADNIVLESVQLLSSTGADLELASLVVGTNGAGAAGNATARALERSEGGSRRQAQEPLFEAVIRTLERRHGSDAVLPLPAKTQRQTLSPWLTGAGERDVEDVSRRMLFARMSAAVEDSSSSQNQECTSPRLSNQENYLRTAFEGEKPPPPRRRRATSTPGSRSSVSDTVLLSVELRNIESVTELFVVQQDVRKMGPPFLARFKSEIDNLALVARDDNLFALAVRADNTTDFGIAGTATATLTRGGGTGVGGSVGEAGSGGGGGTSSGTGKPSDEVVPDVVLGIGLTVVGCFAIGFCLLCCHKVGGKGGRRAGDAVDPMFVPGGAFLDGKTEQRLSPMAVAYLRGLAGTIPPDMPREGGENYWGEQVDVDHADNDAAARAAAQWYGGSRGNSQSGILTPRLGQKVGEQVLDMESRVEQLLNASRYGTPVAGGGTPGHHLQMDLGDLEARVEELVTRGGAGAASTSSVAGGVAPIPMEPMVSTRSSRRGSRRLSIEIPAEPGESALPPEPGDFEYTPREEVPTPPALSPLREPSRVGQAPVGVPPDPSPLVVEEPKFLPARSLGKQEHGFFQFPQKNPKEDANSAISAERRGRPQTPEVAPPLERTGVATAAQVWQTSEVGDGVSPATAQARPGRGRRATADFFPPEYQDVSATVNEQILGEPSSPENDFVFAKRARE